MSLLNFFKQKKEKDSLVLDFGQSAVKGLIFEKKGKLNLIKKFSLQEIEKFGVLEAADFESGILEKATKKVIDELKIQEQLPEIPILMSFSPKILKGKIIEISFRRKNPKQKITKEEEQRILHSVSELAEKRISQNFLGKFGIIPQDLKILKKEILTTRISDYEVPSLLGYKGEKLDFKILVILGLRNNFKVFQQLKSLLGSKNITLFHEVEGLISLVLRNKDISGIFLDIGKEFTQIFSVKKGVEWMEEFSVGGAVFTREICRNFGLSEKEGENLKRRLSKNQLSPEVHQRIESLVSGTLKHWLSRLKEKLREKAKFYSPLPSSFYLFGGGALLPEIKKVLKEENFKNLPLPQILKVNFLKMEGLPLKIHSSLSLDAQALPPILLSFSKYEKENY